MIAMFSWASWLRLVIQNACFLDSWAKFQPVYKPIAWGIWNVTTSNVKARSVRCLVMGWMTWFSPWQISFHNILSILALGFTRPPLTEYCDFPGVKTGQSLRLATLSHVIGWEYVYPCIQISNGPWRPVKRIPVSFCYYSHLVLWLSISVHILCVMT